MSGDPNGTRWANSEKNFGKSLLKKSGWSEGSGLGKDQEGITSHVKVTRKDDVMGIGYKAGVQETWSTQSVGFADVLQRIKKATCKQDDTDSGSGSNREGVSSPVSEGSRPTESRRYRMYAKRNSLKTELLRTEGTDKSEEILGHASSCKRSRLNGINERDCDSEALTTLHSTLLRRITVRHPKHEPKPTVEEDALVGKYVQVTLPDPPPAKCVDTPFLA